MKRAIVTRSDQRVAFQARLSHPQMEAYAARIGADFINLTHDPPVMTADGQRHYRSLQLGTLLTDYDRLLMLDSDVNLHLDRIGNIFDEVPAECVGAVVEDVGSREAERRKRLDAIQQAFGQLPNAPSYINCGVLVVSRRHRDLFDAVDGQYWTLDGNEDTFYSYQITRQGHPLFKLPYTWNHMTMFSEAWNGRPDRFESFIIHYAGHGVFDPRWRTRIEQMRSDALHLHGQRFGARWI